jgi:hypothetical protein
VSGTQDDPETAVHEANPRTQLLRHAVATIAYRGAKAVRGAPPLFAQFRASDSTRTPVEILAHISDLLAWAATMARGKPAWRATQPLPWQQQIERFHNSLAAFDELLSSDADLAATPEQLLQGPLADALTHVGQMALLRRLAGDPIRAENYAQAQIVAGRVGAEQAKPVREF